jgi:glucose/arabinose dehydrogenase
MDAWRRCLPSRCTLARVARAGAFAVLVACDSATAGGTEEPNVDLATDVVATGLDTVWELVWGPDGFIWVTERGGRVSRVNPQSGAVTPVGQVAVAEIGEGGLMGLALHPDFATQPWVYVAHTYASQAGTRNRVVRFRFDGNALGSQEILLTDIPGSSIHNGSRLAIGPDRLLYITTEMHQMDPSHRTAMPSAENPPPDARWAAGTRQSIRHPHVFVRPSQSAGNGLCSRRLALRHGAWTVRQR